MASITCACGSVSITFPSSVPRCHSKCCCDDCYDRFAVLEGGYWNTAGTSASSSSNKTPPRDKPVTWLAFENNIVVRGTGRDDDASDSTFFIGDDDASGNLLFYKLNTADTPSINAASVCCDTFLFGRSPEHHGNCVAVPLSPDAAGRLRDYDADALPLPCYLSFRRGKDRFDGLVDDMPQLASVPEIWSNDERSGNDGTEGWEAAIKTVIAKMREPINKPQERGKSLEEILEDRIIEILEVGVESIGGGADNATAVVKFQYPSEAR